MVPRTLPRALHSVASSASPTPGPPEPVSSHSLSRTRTEESILQQQTMERGSACGAPTPEGLEAVLRDQRSGPAPPSKSNPSLPEIPTEECGLEGKPVRITTANVPARLPTHSLPVPGGQRQHWAVTAWAWPRCTAWGEGTFPHLKGKLGNRRRARPSTALKEGAQVLTQPDLGHLPLMSGLAGTWTGLTQGPSLALLSV